MSKKNTNKMIMATITKIYARKSHIFYGDIFNLQIKRVIRLNAPVSLFSST